MIWSSRPRPRAAGLWATPATSCRRFCWISRAASLCACGPQRLAGHGHLLHVRPDLSLRPQPDGAGLGGRVQLPGCPDGHRDVHRHLPVPGAPDAEAPGLREGHGHHPEPRLLLRIHRRTLQENREQLSALSPAAAGPCAGSPGPELRHRHLRRGPAEGHRAAQRGLPPDHRDRQLPQAGRAHHHGV